jgi:hypothetical protein
MPECGYMGHPMKSSGPPQDHLRTTSEPPCDQIPYTYAGKLLHICHTLGDIQKKWDIPEFSLDILRTYPYVLIINNETED